MAKATMNGKRTGRRPAKITPASKTRTKSEFYSTIAEHTDLSKKQVAAVFDAVTRVVEADLSSRGPGMVNIPGMMRILVQRKPATKAREGINPFTGEKMMFKAKPARNVVKIRPLKGLKSLV